MTRVKYSSDPKAGKDVKKVLVGVKGCNYSGK
jgi:hypothetical protein